MLFKSQGASGTRDSAQGLGLGDVSAATRVVRLVPDFPMQSRAKQPAPQKTPRALAASDVNVALY